MKKKLFDLTLYWDGIKQLRMIGIIFTVIMELEAILVPISNAIDLRQRMTGSSWDPTQNTPQTLGFIDVHPLIVLSYCLFIPLMMLYLFHFLNKRNSSDFYHAIPNTRLSLFFSFMAAVLTWAFFAILLSSASSLIGFWFLREYFSINLVNMGVMLFNTAAACLFVAGAIGIAMSITGTTLSNILVSLLIIFTPRLLLVVFTTTLTDLLPILSSSHWIPPLDPQYNVVTNLIFGAFSGTATESLTFFGGGVYTMIVGVLYISLAALLFRIRKSEKAGQAAVNRVLQTVFRLIASMLVCLFPAVSIVNSMLNPHQVHYESDLFSYFVLYLIAVLVYLLYELVTTRKWREILRSLPALPILVGLNLAFIFGIVGAYHSALSIRPQPEDIQSVSIVDSERNRSYQMNSHEYGYYSLAYFHMRTSDVRHTDKELIQVISDRLRLTCDAIENQRINYYSYGDSDFQWQQVIIRMPGRTIHRNILLDTASLERIASRLSESAAYRDAYLNLPEAESNMVNIGNLTAKQSQEVYRTMRREVAQLDFETWYTYLNNSQGYNSVDFQALDTTMNLSGSYGTKQYSLTIPVPAFLEETCRQYMRYCNEKASAQLVKALAGEYDDPTTAAYSKGGFSLYGYNLDLEDAQGAPTTVSYNASFVELDPDIHRFMEELSAAAAAQGDAAIDLKAPFYRINIEIATYSDIGGFHTDSSTLYVNASPELPPELLVTNNTW